MLEFNENNMYCVKLLIMRNYANMLILIDHNDIKST